MTEINPLNLGKIVSITSSRTKCLGPVMYSRLDMTYSTTRTGITCIVPAPRSIASWRLPLMPFQTTFWLVLSCCLLVEMVGLLLTAQAVEGSSWKKSFDFSYISTLKLFISQGTNFVVTSTAVRIVLFACYMTDIIVTSVYGGGLASILTLPTLEEAPDTIDRMINQQLIWAGISLDWVLTFINSPNKNIHQLLQLFRILNVDELRLKSINERIGFVIERLQSGYLALPNFIERPDRFTVMTEDISYEHVVSYAPRAWSLSQKFNKLCIEVQSSGLLAHWEWMVIAKYFDERQLKKISTSDYKSFNDREPVELGMKNFAGIIVIWFGGTILSLFAFITEVIWFYCNPKSLFV